MHILQLLPSLEVGGVERGVVDLAKGLIARGHRVSVVSSGGSLVDPLGRLGASHYELPVHRKSPWTMWTCLAPLKRLIDIHGIDLVHARSRVPAWIGLFAARQTQRPFVTTAHGFYKPHLASHVMVLGRLVIVPSEGLGRYLCEHFGISPRRIRVIPRGVDLDEFSFQPSNPRSGPWRIGLIGRFSPLKGQAVAMRACRILVREGFDVRLCLAGDAAASRIRRWLEALAQELGIYERIEWLGFQKNVASLIASMDMLVVPSTYPESFGRGVIEAQAVGRPVVASKIGALEEVVENDKSGLLVSPNDPAALANALKRFIQDEALRKQCVETGRRHVEQRWNLNQMVDRTIRVYEECLSQPRILVWKLSALGDVVLSVPSLRAIRNKYRNAHISLAVGRSAYEIVARCPYVNDIVIFDPKKKGRGLILQWRFARRLAAGAYDLSIDLQNTRTTHLLSWLAGIPVRVGYYRKCGWCLNHPVRLPKVAMAPIAHQHHLLREYGIPADGETLEIWPSALDHQRAEELLGAASHPLVGIHPGGSRRWKTKRWDLERWIRLTDILVRKGVKVVVVGGPEEKELGECFRRSVSPEPLILLGQTNLIELACLIQRCDVFLAHDSASLHLAAAVGTTTVALFGPTDPRRHVPPTLIGQVIKKDLFCSPCYSPRCRIFTHACMKRISVEEVLAAVLGFLAEVDNETGDRRHETRD